MLKDALERSTAWNTLQQIHDLLPQIQDDIPAKAVGHYNDVVQQLRLDLQDNNLVHFRIPSSALHMTIIRSQEDSFPFAGPNIEYVCAPKFFKHQLGGIWTYLEHRMSAQMNPPKLPKPGEPRNYWAMTDEELEHLAGDINIPYIGTGADGRAYVDRRIIVDELLKRDKHMSGVDAQSSIVVHGDMRDSTIQQGNHNVAIVEYNKADIQQIVEEVKEQITKLTLSKDHAQEITSDIATVQAQLASPKPKHHIIRESLTSVRHILEHAMGAALAHASLPLLIAYLGHTQN